MHASLAASLLLLASPDALPSRSPEAPAAAPPAALAPASPAPPIPDLRLPRTGLSPGALAAPLVVLAGLGAATVLLRRRRRPAARRVEVLETTSLGPKRALVLARLEGDLLLLGTSEAGIQLLHHRPGPEAAAADLPPEGAPEPVAPLASPEPPGALSGLVTRLRRARPGLRQAQADRTGESARFDALLAESAEDQELRRKLARGQAGSVR